MNVEQIVKQWLKDNGYDGLCEPIISCGCRSDDLFPCDSSGIVNCLPGYKWANGCVYDTKEDTEASKEAGNE